MKSKRKFGHEGSTEYCGGFVDKHGIWNNGFHCPKWGNPGDEYCCGTDRDRFCCPQVDTSTSDGYKFKNHHVGILVGALLLVVLIIFLVTVTICYFCKCCFFSKRRKRPHSCVYMERSRSSENHYARGYPRCTNHSNHAGAIPLTTRINYFPSDSPPPYPGGFDGIGEEKVPLSETQFVNADPEDSPQRLQLSPLLSSPSDESPIACQTRLPTYDGRLDVETKNHYAFGSATTNSDLPMQPIPNDKINRKSSKQCNGNILRPTHSGQNVGSLGEPSERGTFSFQEDNNKGLRVNTDNIKENCNNEQRQLYNMVIVGVEPDLTTNEISNL